MSEPERSADDRAETPLRVGMVLAPTVHSDDDDEESGEPVIRVRLRAFTSALSDAIDARAEPFDFESYPSLLEAMFRGEIDIAWLPPVVALRAAASGRALPFALPVRRGVSAFHTALFTTVGSPIQRPPDLKHVRAAWVDRHSASGFLVIRAALRAQGVDLDQAFAENLFLGSHEAVVRAVLSGKADVGATYLHHNASGSGVSRAGWGDASVHVVARVGPIPSDVFAAGIHVPVARIRAIRQVLVEGKHEKLIAAAKLLMEAERFVAAESEHLKPLEELLDFLEDASRPWRSIFPPPSTR